MSYVFPFGELLNPLVQTDRTPKEIFVLGVYASAVHARWKCGSRVIAQALAVASEPCIFWEGNEKEAREIISRIQIPKELGHLEPAGSNLNGPSGKVLSDYILSPLGYKRSDAWLCDMLPETRLNPNQIKVIKEKYDPLIERYGLPAVTIPERPATECADSFCDEARCREIKNELIESGASVLVLLGDLPIKQFLCRVAQVDFNSLQAYVDKHGYGKSISVQIGDRQYSVIPLAHPRQIGALGAHSEKWFRAHQEWIDSVS